MLNEAGSRPKGIVDWQSGQRKCSVAGLDERESSEAAFVAANANISRRAFAAEGEEWLMGQQRLLTR